MHKRAKECDISQDVRWKVWDRDNGCCIICGSPIASPNAHYIRRSKGGLGIEQNIVTLCLDCHDEFDNGSGKYARSLKVAIRDYLKSKYEDWNEDNLIYDKWKEFEI